MNLLQTFRVALRALMRNKLRSFLTTSGIIIGVAAVIAMVAIGEGAKARVEDAFSAMGSNLLILLPGTNTRGGVFGGFGSLPTLTWDDLKAVQNEAPSVRTAAAVLQAAGPVQSEEQNWTTSITGTTPNYFDIRNWDVVSGARFTQSDVESGNKLVLVGQTVVDKLFGASVDPVGQTIRIKSVPFQIVGVLDKKGQSFGGQDMDDAVFMPQSTFQSKIKGGLQKFISGVVFVSAVSPEDAPRAESQVANILRERHHVAAGADDDFSIRNLSEVAASQQQSMNTLSMLLAVIAAISLFVGGIGIMNIMLVSVTERTREIGIRMAVGARPRNILAQFLVEALTLSVAGGFIGVGLGFAAARVSSNALGWAMLIRPDIIMLSVAFSAIVGVVFGLYPAWKASKLDPIEALRYE